MKPFVLIAIFPLLLCSCTGNKAPKSSVPFDKQVEEYLKKFPYQDTYEYMLKYIGGDPGKLNTLTGGDKPELTKAGEDIVVRMNNDTYYTGGFIYLSEGPVKLTASYSDPDRFYSFQLMDEKNCNFHNIIRPDGDYYLYYGDKPDGADEKYIESPSLIVAVLIRVEVKDKNDASDVEEAKKVFEGISISGPEINELPEVDLLSSFDDTVAEKAHKMMDSVFANSPFRELVASPEQVPDVVSYLNLAAGTKNAWGGPVASHSTYQIMFYDQEGNILMGNKGVYTITAGEPPVKAFWSVTVYDTERGGYFHPNPEDKYHINNTTAVRNEDGTITFHFMSNCEEGNVNCLEVPPGQFDLAVRYYLPKEDLIQGKWSMPLPELEK
jgi:hypothetical protein